MDQYLSAKKSAPGDQMNDLQQTTISPFALSMHSIQSYEIYLFFFLFNLCFGRKPQRGCRALWHEKGFSKGFQSLNYKL